MADITMPQLGETVTEGTITKWFKQVGDEVAEDEPLFEVSTDKVDSEVPSPESGYLAEILVEEGETVDVGTKLAVVSSDKPSGDGQKAEAAEEEQEPEAEEEAEEPEEEEKGEPARAEADEKEEAAQEEAAPGEGDESRPAKAEAEAEKAQERPKAATKEKEKEKEAEAGQAPAEGDGKRAAGKVLSPVVRKLIAEHDLDPGQIEGTGQGGRITRADVLAFIDEGKKAPPAEEKKAPPKEEKKEEKKAEEKAPARPAPQPVAAKAGADDETIPFSNIRRRTAEHMVRSKATSAHVLTAVEADFENVERVRQAAKDEFREREGFSLTYLPFVARAVVDAIEEFPNVNASVGDDALIVHKRVHLGIAVDLSFEGLIVPVVHDADSKRLRAIAREISDLANRARSKKLGADDIAGGTFTITNPGPFGTLITAPVINQPQVAILSTDGVKKRPVAVELPDGSDAVAVHPVGVLALTFDHRAFDGAYASAFVARVKEILETRDWAQEL